MENPDFSYSPKDFFSTSICEKIEISPQQAVFEKLTKVCSQFLFPHSTGTVEKEMGKKTDIDGYCTTQNYAQPTVGRGYYSRGWIATGNHILDSLR